MAAISILLDSDWQRRLTLDWIGRWLGADCRPQPSVNVDHLPTRLGVSEVAHSQQEVLSYRLQATITDVAARAGASIASVSRHLRGHKVRRAEAIDQAVAALAYRPSIAARSLQSGVTRTIGVVVPDIVNPYFAAVVKGAELVSRGAAYTLVLCNTDEDPRREAKVLESLDGRIAAGAGADMRRPADERAGRSGDAPTAGIPEPHRGWVDRVYVRVLVARSNPVVVLHADEPVTRICAQEQQVRTDVARALDVVPHRLSMNST